MSEQPVVVSPNRDAIAAAGTPRLELIEALIKGQAELVSVLVSGEHNEDIGESGPAGYSNFFGTSGWGMWDQESIKDHGLRVVTVLVRDNRSTERSTP